MARMDAIIGTLAEDKGDDNRGGSVPSKCKRGKNGTACYSLSESAIEAVIDFVDMTRSGEVGIKVSCSNYLGHNRGMISDTE